MLGIIGIIAVLTVLGLSLLITRIAATALALTGLSREAARFQARSAFTGTGFTTREAEKVVDHPLRRKIIMLLMITRSAGVVSIIISLILSFSGDVAESQKLYRLLWLIGGIFALWGAASSHHIDRYLSRLIEWALRRWTDLDTRDYQSLLKLSGEYAVKELSVKDQGWLEDKLLRDCQLSQEGVIVLGIYRDSGGTRPCRGRRRRRTIENGLKRGTAPARGTSPQAMMADHRTAGYPAAEYRRKC